MFRGRHFDRSIILLCVRWYLAYGLSLRDRSRRRLKPIRTRQSQYLNNRIEQDHRSVKRRVRPMLGFKSTDSARTILGGIEMIGMMRKHQARYAFNPRPSLAEQFDILAA